MNTPDLNVTTTNMQVLSTGLDYCMSEMIEQ